MKFNLLTLSSVALCLGCNSTQDKKENETSKNELPNVIIFHVDDLGWTDLGCYGSEYYETPNIDKLCEEGMKFTNAYAPAAICSPSRASIQTGKYTARLGVTDWIRASFQKDTAIDYNNPPEYDLNQCKNMKTPFNINHLDLEEKTIGEYMKQGGYKTAHIGKWHLGDEKYYPTQQGYDINIAGCDYGEPPSFFDPYHREAKTYPWGDEPAFSLPTLEPRKEGEYLIYRLADEASKIIDENKDTSFFIFYNFYGVHTPIEAPGNLIKKYENKKPSQYHNNPVYAAMIEAVDNAVGQVMNKLDSLGLTKNTLIFFTSDNGGLLSVTSNHPLRQGKGDAFEGGIRVPFIAKWEGKIPKNTVSDYPFTSMNLLPTLADILNLETGKDIDGFSMIPELMGDGMETKDLFWHFPHYRGNNVPYTIVRSDSMKLIKFYDGDSLKMYNLKQDISEENDLSGSLTDVRDSLLKKIDHFVTQTQAKLPVYK
ncbi:MAG: sulfatase [Bacteroidota bacterium]